MCVVEGTTKTKENKTHESTGPLEWALGLWYRQRKTTSSLVQYQTLHRRERFFFVFFFRFFLFSQMKAPDNLWFVAFQPSGEFLKVEKTNFVIFFFFSINSCFLPYYIEAGMIINVSYCIFFHFYSLIVSFFDQQVTKE